MKAALAAAMSCMQNLDSDDSRERPVDRLAALGAIQVRRADRTREESELASLGVDLIAFKIGNRAESRLPAEEKLGDILGWNQWGLGLRAPPRAIIAAWAIREWVIDVCPTCKGAKEIPNDFAQAREGVQPMRCCPPSPEGCGGTGKRRYTDQERVEAMGQDFSRAMYQAHGIIARAEALAIRGAMDMLERW